MMSNNLLQSPRGTKDILPEDQKYWHEISLEFSECCQSFGAGKISTPMFEYAEVFDRSLGSSSDIVNKEMYEVNHYFKEPKKENYDDDDKRRLILKPEGTAPIIRAWFEHGLSSQPQPVKLFYIEPIFRYERPQSGRLRIHHQLGLEIIGDGDALTDASLIFLAWRFFKKIGLENQFDIDINSVGCSSCRPKMKKKLAEYFEPYLMTLCPDCNRRFSENPLRIFDCKEEKCQKIIASAPALVDLLCESCKNHFKEVLENLDNLQISYNLNPKLVRGLDYYTKTVFEFYDKEDKSRMSSFLGGGRYDSLIKLYGGPDTPAIGFGAGIERIIEKIKKLGIEIKEKVNIDTCIVQIGERARKICLPLVAELEDNGIRATCVLGKDSLKAQLRSASKIGAPICLIIGQREVLDKSVIVRDMEDASQETIKISKLIEFIKSRKNKK